MFALDAGAKGAASRPDKQADNTGQEPFVPGLPPRLCQLPFAPPDGFPEARRYGPGVTRRSGASAPVEIPRLVNPLEGLPWVLALFPTVPLSPPFRTFLRPSFAGPIPRSSSAPPVYSEKSSERRNPPTPYTAASRASRVRATTRPRARWCRLARSAVVRNGRSRKDWYCVSPCSSITRWSSGV